MPEYRVKRVRRTLPEALAWRWEAKEPRVRIGTRSKARLWGENTHAPEVPEKLMKVQLDLNS